MKIAHIALWTNDIEKLKEFYVRYFGGISNEKYINPHKKFASYLVAFDGGTAIEIMECADVKTLHPENECLGWAHLAFSVGSKDKVDEMTELFRKNGYAVIGEPRTTGDGFYESVILDPEGNRVEITD